MPLEYTQSQTAEPLVFMMVDALLHIAGKTGASPTVTISKNGGAFGSPAGAVSEIANGWYKVAPNATDFDTLGSLILHAEASGADPVDDRYQVVAQNRRVTSMGLSLAKTTNLTGLNDIAATAIVTSGAITTAAGVAQSDLRTVAGQSVTCAASVTVNTNVGTTQPVNHTGTGASALVKADAGTISL
jgi:hypothetical protein